MSGKAIRRVLVPGAFAVFLLAGPAWASNREADSAATFWQWLANFWRGGLSALWTGGSPSVQERSVSPGVVPPDGGGRPNTATADGDQGWGVDPNGRP
jgi:hypothetical protein